MKNLYIQPEVAIMTIANTSALCAGSSDPTPPQKTLQQSGSASEHSDIKIF